MLLPDSGGQYRVNLSRASRLAGHGEPGASCGAGTSNVQRFHNDFNSLSYRSLAIYNIPKYSAQVASVA